MAEPHIVCDSVMPVAYQVYRHQQFFDELKHQLNTQDNAITADPLFVVFQKKRITGMDTDYADDNQITWIEDGEEVRDPKRVKVFERYYRLFDQEPENVTRTGFIVVDEFVTACFTRNGAEEYLACNKHNLHEPFIYVMSMWRNKEMTRLRNILKGDA